jgi:hypothetical protein
MEWEMPDMMAANRYVYGGDEGFLLFQDTTNFV